MMLEAVMRHQLPHAESLMRALIGEDERLPRQKRTAAWALKHTFFYR